MLLLALIYFIIGILLSPWLLGLLVALIIMLLSWFIFGIITVIVIAVMLILGWLIGRWYLITMLKDYKNICEEYVFKKMTSRQ